MVVVEQASSSIGQTVEVEFIRSLQTAAGKMMFARKTEQPQQSKQKAIVSPARRPVGKKPVAKQPEKQQPKKQAGNASGQRRRSVDREARLLELVDKQN